MSQRWKLVLEFDGTPFVGWQQQPEGLSVQQVLEQALYRFCGEKVEAVTAGRTDSGVHALGLVVHADIPRDASPETVLNALNFHMKPHPVSVLSAEPVGADFHARFSCRGRAYVYRILNRVPPPTLEWHRVWHVRRPLDAEAMHRAAQFLVGHHDFSTFRDARCQAKSPLRTLDRLDVVREGDVISVYTEARSFLHHQVRNMVGTLKLVGEGKWTPDQVREALELRDRRAGGPTAPAHGLYFFRAVYQGLGADGA
ncbi:MAG: tRNA pseudouridine(38-40) synthase TruA [Pseudomonadota bacterium]|nr:tRNA pseudouridine(38-40) synthase TruA [Pseudomonadota bacterium]